MREEREERGVVRAGDDRRVQQGRSGQVPRDTDVCQGFRLHAVSCLFNFYIRRLATISVFPKAGDFRRSGAKTSTINPLKGRFCR